MVFVLVMMAVFVTMNGKVMIVQFLQVELPPLQNRLNNAKNFASRGKTFVRHAGVSLDFAGKIFFNRVQQQLQILYHLRQPAHFLVGMIAIAVSDGNVLDSNVSSLLQAFVPLINTCGSVTAFGSHGACQCSNGL